MDSNSEQPNADAAKAAPHHVSKILDEVLHDPEIIDPVGKSEELPKRRLKHPMALDLSVAVGLLLAVAGFTAGLMRMYVDHSAELCLMKNDYSAAVILLEGAPLPFFLNTPGSHSRELLDRAHYLDATQKLMVSQNDPSALKELEKIYPGSKLFDYSQEILTEHFTPSQTTLQGSLSKVEQITEQEQLRRQKEALRQNESIAESEIN